MPDLQNPRLARGYRLQWEDTQQCHVLLYPEGMITLDPLTYQALSRCDGTRTPTQIANALQPHHPQAQTKVPHILHQAQTHGWLED